MTCAAHRRPPVAVTQSGGVYSIEYLSPLMMRGEGTEVWHVLTPVPQFPAGKTVVSPLALVEHAWVDGGKARTCPEHTPRD
jgi:hypothetical protein